MNLIMTPVKLIHGNGSVETVDLPVKESHLWIHRTAHRYTLRWCFNLGSWYLKSGDCSFRADQAIDASALECLSK